MRLAWLVVVACVASACGGVAPRPAAVSLPAPSASCVVPPTSKPDAAELCASPASFTHDFQHRGLEDVMFASCDVFVPEFFIRVGFACDLVARDLAEAMMCRAGPEPCREDRAGRDEMLGNAAAEHLEPRCRGWSTRIAWGAAIGGDASCTPGHDVARGPIHLAPDVVVSMSDVPVGAWTYAIALEPHLGALGKQYLRKFLVCQALETEAARGGEARLHRFLGSAPQ